MKQTVVWCVFSGSFFNVTETFDQLCFLEMRTFKD